MSEVVVVIMEVDNGMNKELDMDMGEEIKSHKKISSHKNLIGHKKYLATEQNKIRSRLGAQCMPFFPAYSVESIFLRHILMFHDKT